MIEIDDIMKFYNEFINLPTAIMKSNTVITDYCHTRLKSGSCNINSDSYASGYYKSFGNNGVYYVTFYIDSTEIANVQQLLNNNKHIIDTHTISYIHYIYVDMCICCIAINFNKDVWDLLNSYCDTF